MKLLLNDILNLSEEEIENSKIEFNMRAGSEGQLFLDRWLKNTNQEKMTGTCKECSFWGWYGIKQRNFHPGQVVFSFARMTEDEWLFISAAKIVDTPENDWAEVDVIDKYAHLFGKLIIQCKKGNTFSRYVFNLKKYLDQAVVKEILPNMYSGESFEGDTREHIPYHSLDDIFNRRNLTVNDVEVTDIGKNTILYGPPGTGKTYNTVLYSVAIIENKKLETIKDEEYDEVLSRYNKYKEEGLIEFTTFHQSYGYEEFIEGIKPVMESNDDNQGDIQYQICSGLFKSFCDKASHHILKQKDTVLENKRNYVFVIDEINRGNISKIFGELITLIEPTKRIGQPEGMKVKLPYSKKLFGVSDNVYLIGTMNTADRSIAAIDTALRRRFFFKEMLPDAKVLEGIYVEGISIKEIFLKMNKRISVLYDREHTLGHAYFLPLKTEPTVEILAKIFTNNIIPLLQEYFYEDYEKIRLVLGDNNKQNVDEQFITLVENNYNELFGSTEYDFDEINTYEINYKAFENIEAYRLI